MAADMTTEQKLDFCREMIHACDVVLFSQNTWAIAAAKLELQKMREQYRELFPAESVRGETHA